MSPKTFKLVVIASLAIVLICCLVAHAKPFRRGTRDVRLSKEIRSIRQRDPLLAVASEAVDDATNEQVVPQQYYFQNQQMLQYEQPQYHEIIQYEPVEFAGRQVREEQLVQPRLERKVVVEHVMELPQSLAQQQHPSDHHNHHADQPDQHEYVSIIDAQHPSPAADHQGREYPGELVYIRQAGESQEQQTTSGEHMSKLGAAISRHPGMPATILTEVPVDHMPIHVLDKLRRDYGVKVVATREHPGANLVINCDDHFGRADSICARQAPALPELPISPYTFVAGQSNQSEFNQGEQPKTTSEISTEVPSSVYKADDMERLKAGMYMDRRGETRANDEPANEFEAYGIRNTPPPTISSDQPSEYHESGPQNDQPTVEPKTEAQPEPTYEGSQAGSDFQNAGFDAEPSNNQEQKSPRESTQ